MSAATPTAPDQDVDRYEAVRQYSLGGILGCGPPRPSRWACWHGSSLLGLQTDSGAMSPPGVADRPHGWADLAIRAGPDPSQAGAGVTGMVAGARRTLAPATEIEDRTRGRKGVVVGAALRRPGSRVVDGARDPRPSARDFGDFLGRPWRGFLQRRMGLVRAHRRVCRLQHRARRGAALPGLLLPRMQPSSAGRLGRQRGAVHPITCMCRGSCRPPWWRASFSRPTRRGASKARGWGSSCTPVQSVFVIGVVLALVLK